MSAFLVYSADGRGTLSLIWSRGESFKETDFVLLEATPSRGVPAFKFTQNKGVNTLMRDVQADKRKYFQGIASFIRAVNFKAYECKIKLAPEAARAPIPFQVAFLLEGNSVEKLTNSPVRIDRFVYVAVVSGSANCFDAKRLDPQLFRAKATELQGEWGPLVGKD